MFVEQVASEHVNFEMLTLVTKPRVQQGVSVLGGGVGFVEKIFADADNLAARVKVL